MPKEYRDAVCDAVKDVGCTYAGFKIWPLAKRSNCSMDAGKVSRGHLGLSAQVDYGSFAVQGP